MNKRSSVDAIQGHLITLLIDYGSTLWPLQKQLFAFSTEHQIAFSLAKKWEYCTEEQCRDIQSMLRNGLLANLLSDKRKSKQIMV